VAVRDRTQTPRRVAGGVIAVGLLVVVAALVMLESRFDRCRPG
jgi:hypothetical protein